MSSDERERCEAMVAVFLDRAELTDEVLSGLFDAAESLDAEVADA